MSAPAARRPTKTFTTDQVVHALQAKGIPHQIAGRQVNADLAGSGHHHLKISPHKGVYLNAATGKGGTIASLLRRIGVQAPAPGAQAPAHPAAGGNLEAEQAAKIARVQAIWGEGWACSVSDEVYKGPALDSTDNVQQRAALRSRMHAARDAAFAYFASRKLDSRWMPQLRIFLLDLSQKDDYAMKQKGAIAGLAFPMFNNKVLVGLQRLYLSVDGKKISRMMLGKLGDMNLVPLDSAPIIKLPDEKPIMLWGEGWETCAHAVQSSHLPATVLFDAGQVRKRAEMYLEQSATATAEQIAAMPVMGLLVDRDVSNTGQNACIYASQLLRKAGLQSLYLVPPDLVKGGEKGDDWADAAEELGHAAAGVALSVAMHQQPLIPDMPEDRNEAQFMRGDGILDISDDLDAYADQEEEILLENFGVRERVKKWRVIPIKDITERPVAPVPPVHTPAAAREIMRVGIERGLIPAYVEWLGEYRKARAADRNATPPPFPPYLFKPSTGAGKSSHLKRLPNNPDIRMADGAIRVFVATREECDSYADANRSYFQYHGRNPLPASPGYCPNHKEMMRAVDKGHVPQAEFCFNCKNGLKWAMEHHGEDNERGHAAIQQLHAMGLTRADMDALEPCVWQQHLRDALAEQFVVATYHSYSDNLATWHSPEIGPVPALACFDEDAPMGVEVEKVTHERIHEWTVRIIKHIERIDRDITYFQNLDDGEDHSARINELTKNRGRLADAQAALLAIARELAALTGKSGRIPEQSPVWALIAKLMDDADGAMVAEWEDLKFERDGSLSDVPLRAAYAISQTIQINEGLIEDGGLKVSAVRPMLQRLGHLPTALFNATPSPLDESIVRAKGGVIIDAIAQQNIRIFRYPDRFYGIRRLKMGGYDPKRQKREVDRYKKLIAMYGNHGKIIHKDARDFIDPEQEMDLLRHWGGGHRAQNDFSGKDMLIVGSFFIPNTAVRHVYQSHRLAALTAGADPEDWPQFPDGDDAFEKDAWIDEGGTEVQCPLPLPVDPKIRAWFLSMTTAETVQAVGRARGVNHTGDKPLEIHIYGGVPLAGITRYGLQVAEYRHDQDALGMTREGFQAAQAEQARMDAMAAAMRAAAAGDMISRGTVDAHVRVIRTERIESARKNETQGVCAGMVNIPITMTAQTPADGEHEEATADGLHSHVYQKWLQESGMPIFAMLMQINGRAAAAVRAAQQAIMGQTRHDAEALFDALEQWGASVVSDGITLDDAIANDVDFAENKKIARFIDAAVMKEDLGAATILNPHHENHRYIDEWLKDRGAQS